MDVLAFLGTAGPLGVELFQEPFFVLWLIKQNYCQSTPKFNILFFGEIWGHRPERKMKKRLIHGTLDSGIKSAKYQMPTGADQCLHLEAAFNWHVLRPAKVWDANGPQQHLLHPGPHLLMSGDLIAYTVCFEGLGKDSHSCILPTE